MTVSREYLDHVADLLAPFGPVTIRRMFGGAGIYRDGVMFALVDDDVLYFRVDNGNRAAFETAGAAPFVVHSGTMPYYQVPEEVLEDGEALANWARGAWEAARRQRKPRRSAPPASVKTKPR